MAKCPAKSEGLKKKYQIRPSTKSFDTREKLFLLNIQVALGTARKEALRTGLVYQSKKGSFKYYNRNTPSRFMNTNFPNWKLPREYRKEWNEGKVPYRTENEKRAFVSLDENPLVLKWYFLTKAILHHNPRKKRNFDRPVATPIELEIFYSDGKKKWIFIRPEGLTFEQLKSTINAAEVENATFEVWTEEYFKSLNTSFLGTQQL